MISLLLVVAGAAQPVPTAWSFGVRVDPVVFALAGFSVGVDGAPDDSHWRASMAAFHVDVPEVLLPLIVRPSSGVRLTEDALQLGAFYDVDEHHRGFTFGPELYVYALTYHAGGDVAVAREAYAHVTGGYLWFPFDGVGFFLEPWATLGVPVFHSGGADVGGRHLEDRPLNWHATVSLGLRFP